MLRFLKNIFAKFSSAKKLAYFVQQNTASFLWITALVFRKNAKFFAAKLVKIFEENSIVTLTPVNFGKKLPTAQNCNLTYLTILGKFLAAFFYSGVRLLA
jgi:hypothetical protein